MGGVEPRRVLPWRVPPNALSNDIVTTRPRSAHDPR
jgi:hypothetical protein